MPSELIFKNHSENAIRRWGWIGLILLSVPPGDWDVFFKLAKFYFVSIRRCPPHRLPHARRKRGTAIAVPL